MPGKPRSPCPPLTESQTWASDELRRIACEHPSNLALIEERGTDASGCLAVVVQLPVGELTPGAGGLSVEPTEDVLIRIPPSFPTVPPQAWVEHDRFIDCAHVLQGQRLCVYLDPDREWHPSNGIVGYLEALWNWFDDAIAGRFDATTALYHPVGGVLHQTPGCPTVVIRLPLPDGSAVRRAHLVTRTRRRLDLLWDRPDTAAELAVLIVTPSRLPFGAQQTLGGLLASLDHAGSSPHRVLSALSACARRNPSGLQQTFVLAVLNPVNDDHYLLAGRVDPATTEILARRTSANGPVIHVDSTTLNLNSPIEWCAMSDERPEITTRRDASRPVSSYLGKTVQIWGCGGLGSWIAELIVRAGAANVLVCDPAAVGGGLLVRQNYTEADIGENKAEALAARLRQLSDNVTVVVAVGQPDIASIEASDLIVDATVNLAVGHWLDEYARSRGDCGPVIASVATDIQSATLGLLVTAPPGYLAGPATIDDLVADRVRNDPSLARYHPLWSTPQPGDELIPARGCSTPTFHGSAADLVGVAGVLTSLLGQQLLSRHAGLQMIGLPHAAVDGPAHVALDAPDP